MEHAGWFALYFQLIRQTDSKQKRLSEKESLFFVFIQNESSKVKREM